MSQPTAPPLYDDKNPLYPPPPGGYPQPPHYAGGYPQPGGYPAGPGYSQPGGYPAAGGYPHPGTAMPNMPMRFGKWGTLVCLGEGTRNRGALRSCMADPGAEGCPPSQVTVALGMALPSKQLTGTIGKSGTPSSAR